MPKAPIRNWQIWNEQNAPWLLGTRQWAPGYTTVLKAAYQAIKGVDTPAPPSSPARSSRSAGPTASGRGVRDLYKAGAKR